MITTKPHPGDIESSSAGAITVPSISIDYERLAAFKRKADLAWIRRVRDIAREEIRLDKGLQHFNVKRNLEHLAAEVRLMDDALISDNARGFVLMQLDTMIESHA